MLFQEMIENRMFANIKQIDAISWATFSVTIVICCFIIFSVTFLNSYSIFAILIVCCYLFFLNSKLRKRIQLSRTETVLIIIMFCYSASFFIEFFLFNSNVRILDRPSKVLLLIPLIPLLNAVKPDYRYIIGAFIIGSGILFGLATYETYFLGQERARSLINPLQFGAIAIAIASAAIAFPAALPHKTQKQKILVALSICLAAGGFVAGVMSQTRGSIIAIPFILLLIGVLYLPRIRFSNIKTALVISTVLILTVVSVYNSSAMKRFHKSINNTLSYHEGSKTNTSIGIRLGQWEVALKAGLQSPLLGLGHQEFVRYKNQQVELGFFGKELLRYDNSHSTYANTFARRGMVGLTAIILFLGFPIYIGLMLWRKSPAKIAPYAIGLSAFGSAFFISNISQEVIFHNTGIIMYTGLLVILTSLLSERVKASGPRLKNE
jgi:O-antigen ligase